MAKQEQVTGDGSSSQQAGRDIINVGPTYNEIQQIFHDLMKGELAIARLEAQAEMNRRLEHFADKLIPALIDKNISADEFSKPEVQLFVHETQRRYLESGQDEPSEITIDLVTQSLGESPGSPRGLIFKEAAKIASSINLQTANFISLLFILTRTKKTFDVKIAPGSNQFDLERTAISLVDHVEADLKLLLPVSHPSQTDKDYLRMIGVLEANQFSSFDPETYIKQYADSFPKPLNGLEVGEMIALGAKEDEFAWIGTERTHALFVPKAQIDFTTFSFDKLVANPGKSDRDWITNTQWQARIQEKGGPIVEDAILQAASSNETFLQIKQMHSEGIIGREFLTPIGLALGLSNARRLGKKLDDRIWFPN